LPKRGQINDLPTGLPAPRRALAEAVRELVALIGASYAEISKALAPSAPGASEIHLSRQALCDLANGKRKRPPRLEPVAALHRLALAEAAKTGVPVITWDELEDLCRALAPTPPPRPEPSPTCTACGAVTPLELALSTLEPADLGVLNEATAAPAALPVPRQRGDRQRSGSGTWPSITLVEAYLDAGNLERASGLLRHAGGEASPEEAAEAIAACGDRRLVDATEILIQSAGSRPPLDVMRIVHGLNRQDQWSASDTLLERALSIR